MFRLLSPSLRRLAEYVPTRTIGQEGAAWEASREAGWGAKRSGWGANRMRGSAEEANKRRVSRPLTMLQWQAPNFSNDAVFPDGTVSRLDLTEYRENKGIGLIFYPRDFSFVCPTELVGFSDKIDEFLRRDTKLAAISTDSIESHKEWLRKPRSEGGVGKLNFPLVSDETTWISRRYSALSGQRFAVRTFVYVDAEGKIRYHASTDVGVGRSLDEILRVIDGVAHADKSGQVCPLNWKPGQEALDPNIEAVQQYFKKQAH